MNRLATEIRSFCTEHLLKEKDIYRELREFVIDRYKKEDLGLIQLQESNDEEKITENHPYYQYKSVFDCDKIEYID